MASPASGSAPSTAWAITSARRMVDEYHRDHGTLVRSRLVALGGAILLLHRLEHNSLTTRQRSAPGRPSALAATAAGGASGGSLRRPRGAGRLARGSTPTRPFLAFLRPFHSLVLDVHRLRAASGLLR